MPSTPFAPPPGQHVAQDRMEDARNYNAWLLARARPYLGRRILDLGAGTGTFAGMLPADAEVVAVEPDAAFAELLRERFAGREGVTVVAEPAETFVRREVEPFDTVVCFNVLEHIRDDAAVLAGIRDVLAPGGRLAAIVPAHERLYGEIDRRVGHERRYSCGLVRRRLREAGLALDEVRYVNPVGALGWLVSSRLLRAPEVPETPLKGYDRLVPLLRPLDRLRLPFGLSVWAVAHRPRSSTER